MAQKKCFLIIILFFIFWNISAQNQEYFRPNMKHVNDYYTKFDVLTTDDGLSNNTINVIYQDKYGYMWFGTKNGLNKYNGYEINIYNNIKNDSSSLSGNSINDITEDENGNLWIATNYGLNLYNRKGNNFTRFLVDTSTNNCLQDNNTRSLFSDTLGNLWIDTYNGYLHKLSIKNYSIEFYKYTSTSKELYHISYITEDGDKLWITDMGSNTAIFDKSKKTFSYLKDKGISVSLNYSDNHAFAGQTSLVKDKYGNYYFGVSHHRSVVYNPSVNKITTTNIPSVYTTIKDNRGNLWMGGFSFGLLKYNIESNIMTHYKNSQNNPKSIPHNRIFSIFIDKIGDYWIGTVNGVAKLSPQKNQFTHLRNIAGNTNTILSNAINDVIQTKDSNLWLATKDGLSNYNITNNTVKNITHQKNSNNTLLHNNVRTLYQDKNDKLWIGIWAGLGFNSYNINTETFKSHVYNSYSRGSDWYIGFAEDKFNKFYTAFWNGDGMALFDRENNSFKNKVFRLGFITNLDAIKTIKYFDNKIWTDNFYVHNIKESYGIRYLSLEYKSKELYKRQYTNPKNFRYIDIDINERLNNIYTLDNTLYFATNYGLLQYNPLNENIFRITKKEQDIKCISKSTNSLYYWIGTTQGLFLINKNTGKEYISIDNKSSEHINNDEFHNLMLDNTGVLWAVTKTEILKIRLVDFKTKKFDIEIFEEELCDKRITDIIQDNNSIIWISTENGLNAYDANANIIKQYSANNSKLKSNIIHDLYIDSENNMWVGGEKGIAKYDSNADEFKVWQHDLMNPHSLSDNVVFDICENNIKELIIATGKGYSKLNIETNEVIRCENKSENHLNYGLSTCIFTDSKGNVWKGTDGGNRIDKYEPKTETFVHYYDYPYDSTSYKGNTTNFVFEDSKGIIWVGSDKGLNKFDSINQSFILYNMDYGFPTNDIVGMEEDNKGDFWLSTKKGLVKFSENKGVIRIFNKIDGISSNNFTTNAYAKLFDGRIVFGSDRGLTLFHPDSIKENDALITPLFTSLYVFDSIVREDLCDAKNVILDYTENNFFFEFAANDFINPLMNKYAYKLEGYDDDWIYTNSTNRKAKYTSLAYGNYKLLLKASNNEGVWNNTPVSINIQITPPFWHTSIAYFAYFILLIFLIMSIIKLRTKKIKRQNAYLEATVKERTSEVLEKNEKIIEQKIAEELRLSEISAIRKNIDEQEELRLRIASELHDGVGGSLTGVKLFIENIIIEKKIPELNELLHDLDKTYLMVRNISHDLIPPEFEFASLMEILRVYVEQIKKRSDLEVVFSAFPNTGWSNLDESLQVEIYRIIQELLTNTIKHASASEIEMQMIMHDEFVNIIIEDNGLGFNFTQKSEGIGLRSLKNRVNNRHGELDIDSVQGRGTIVNIKIPRIDKAKNYE